MDFACDQNVLNVGDQYMFGPALMICPVYQYKARNREVYFPCGKVVWYDFYTGKQYQGGQKLSVDAPYNRMPIFVAGGSIIPMGDIIQSTKEEQKDLTVYVFAGRDGSFNLYEDEGVNYNYEKGAYSTIPFTYNDADKILTIGERKGEFDGMAKDRTFTIRCNSGIDAAKASGVKVKYDGKAQTVKL